MSFRTSLTRAARPALARAAQPSPIVGRRAASSSHAPSSNMPWALGSAAVFGSLAAFILMPSGDKAADHVHDSVEAKGAGAHVREAGEKPQHEGHEHDNARELMRKERAAGDRAQHDEDPKGKMMHADENRSRTEMPSKRDDEKPMRRGPSTGEDFQTGQDNTIDPKHMQAGIANKGYNSDGKGVASGDSTGSDSGKDVKESVEQAVKSNAPKVAAAAEEAQDTASDKFSELKDKASSKASELKDKASELGDKAKSAAQGSSGSTDGSDADEPSQKDIVDSLHQAENVAVPRAAMADERK